MPQKLRYPQSRIALKHYGKYLQQFVEKVAKESNGARTTHEMVNIARYMRTKGYEFNNEHPNNEAIIRDIRAMAGDEVQMDLSAIVHMRSEYRPSAQQRNQRRKTQVQKHHSGRKAAKSARPQQRHNQHK
jgi:hypothetical protein